MNDPLRELADLHFQECCGIRFDELTAPLGEANPAGPSLRGGPIYREINEARREDDPTLPLGPWAYELKRADWPGAIQASAEALAGESKDLQLCIWLLEGQIHHYGLAGIAPTVTLIAELCERYWVHLHPRAVGEAVEGQEIDEDTLEARANLFEWINEKLLPALRLVPLTAAGGDRPELCWSDWERAARNEQLRRNHGAEAAGKLEGPTLQECAAALAATPTEAHLARLAAIGAGSAAIDRLQAVLDLLCGDDAPTFSALRGLIDPMRQLLEGEMRKRGITPAAAAWHPRAPGNDDAPAEGGRGAVERCGTAADEPAVPPTLRDARRGDRDAAYALLAELTEVLMRIEPHSPVPALLRRAVEWGTMNTRELYEELFLRLNGQLNIFELLGVEFDANHHSAEGG